MGTAITAQIGVGGMGEVYRPATVACRQAKNFSTNRISLKVMGNDEGSKIQIRALPLLCSHELRGHYRFRELFQLLPADAAVLGFDQNLANIQGRDIDVRDYQRLILSD